MALPGLGTAIQDVVAQKILSHGHSGDPTRKAKLLEKCLDCLDNGRQGNSWGVFETNKIGAFFNKSVDFQLISN